MWLISLFAVILCSYFLAKMTANLIAMKFEGKWVTGGVVPPEAPGSEAPIALSPEETLPIVERNIFNSAAVGATARTEGEEEETTGPEEEVPEGEAVATSLKIKLTSTFSVGQGADERSTCIIDSGSGKEPQDVYTVNDEKQFAPETKIVKILYNRVEFVHKGRLEYVELEDFASGVAINVPPAETTPTTPTEEKGGEAPGVEKTSETSFVIDRAEIDEALENLDKLYTQIRAVPHFKEGKPNGLKLLSVRSGSIFSKLGLKRGDILQKINGMDLDIRRGLEMFNQLKSESKIVMEVERRGNPQTLEYEIR